MTEETTQMRLPSLYQTQRQPQEEGGLMGSAFRLENDVYNIYQLARRGTDQLDQTFSIADAATNSDLWEDHRDLLATAQSQPEFDAISNRIRQESVDRARVAQAGLAGFGASMLAGSISPVMFIPLTGQARGAAGVRQAFALAAGAATAQELPLLANQELRSGVESGTAIAAGTILGGLLGSGAVFLRGSDRARLARDIMPETPDSQMGFVIRRPDGEVVRIGESMPLQMPAGIARSPQAYTQIQTATLAYNNVMRAIRGDDWAGVRRLIDDPKTDFNTRAFAQDMLEGTTPRALRESAAVQAGATPEVARAWGDFSDATARATTPEQALTARAEFAEALDALGVPREEQPTLFATLEQAGSARTPGAEDIARQMRNEQISANLSDGAEVLPAPRSGVGAGAKRVDEEFTPMMRQFDPESGQVVYRPVQDADAPVDAGVLAKDPYGALTQIARINPIVYNVQQPGMPIKSQLARKYTLLLSDGGVEYTGASVGIPPAKGGTAESRINYYYARLGDALETQYSNYLKYLGRKDTFVNRRATDFQATFNISPGGGKVSFKEFKEQVMDSFHNGGQSQIPEANETAQAWSKRFFGAFNESMLEATEGRGARALYDVLDDADPMKSYVSHIYSVDKISNDREGFIGVVADYLQSNAAAVASRRWQKLQMRNAEGEELEALLRLEAEEARIELDRIDAALRAGPQEQNFSPELEALQGVREQRRSLIDDEYERLLESGSVYRRGDADSEHAAMMKARENMKEQYRQLTDDIARREASLAPDTRTTLDERKALRRRRNALTKSFGRMQEKQADALRKIEKNDEANLRSLERFEQEAVKLSARLDQIDDAQLNKELTRLERQFDKALGQIEKSEARIAKLSENAGTEFEPTERISIAEAQRAMRQQRAENSLDRYAKAASYDREGARQALRDRMQSAREYTNRVNSKRSERNAKLRDSFRANDPEQVTARIQQAQGARASRVADFQKWLDDAGAETADLETGTFDFRTRAQDYAAMLSYKITGSPMRVAQLDTLPELKGPMKHRVLDIPYEIKKSYLEMDSERVAGVYTRSMGADIELFRLFGSTNGKNALGEIDNELKAIERNLRSRKTDENGKEITQAQRAKQLKAHERGAREVLLNFEHSLTRLRGMAGIPQDPSSFWYRLGRSVMHLNVATMMGPAAITSIPDMGRAIMAHGTTRVFRDSWMPLISGLTNIDQRQLNRAQIDQLKLSNIGIEMATQQRAQSGFDITMDTSGRTRVERAIEMIGVKTPQIALFGPQTDFARIVTGMATMSRFLSNIDNYYAGRMKPNDGELSYMAQAGLSPDLMERIYRQYNAPEGHTVHRGVKVPNMEAWTDYEAMRSFTAALSRESNRIVVQPGLERLRISDQNILSRMIFQFRSFTLGAHSKILLSGLQQRDVHLYHQLQGTMFSLGLGALSYAIWALSAGERQTEEMKNASWERWLDQAIYRSGLLGAFSEVQSIGTTIPAVSDYVTFEGSRLAGRRPTSVLGATLGPTFGQMENAAGLLTGIDEPTQGTLRQARRMMPYQNVFYWRRPLDMVEEGLAQALNIPETRQ